MKTSPLHLPFLGILLAVLPASAATRYVDVNSTSPVPPYTSWSTAANVIQDAVDAADPGDTVLVTNGVYDIGGKAVYRTMTNRVAVDKPLTLLSANGPEFTIIKGYQIPGTTNGVGAIRCVYLTNGAALSGFTLTKGATRTYKWEGFPGLYGGGVWCAGIDSLVSNCIIATNTADTGGGGVYGGTLNYCLLTGNSAPLGGGAYNAVLNGCRLSRNSAQVSGGGAYLGIARNCAVTKNVAETGGGAQLTTLLNCTITLNQATSWGGGVNSARLTNCIIYYNSAPMGANYRADPRMAYCFTTPDPGGTGNSALDPQMASALYLSASSPCRGAGDPSVVTGADIDGETWLSPPSIGCDEYYAGSDLGPLSVGIEADVINVTVDYPVQLSAIIEGHANLSEWDFGDGTTATNQQMTTHAWAAPGIYEVVLRAFNTTYPEGVSHSRYIQVQDITHYVSVTSPNPVFPFSSWTTAARTIQDAVDAATAVGARVLVNDGVYSTGGRSVVGSALNRVVVNKPIHVWSVNGPQFTIIEGAQVPGTLNGDGAIRCVYLSDGAKLSGFTLRYGGTRLSGDELHERSGGAVWCESDTEIISNCVLVANSAGSGGGVSGGTLMNCMLVSNTATGPGFSLDGGAACGGGAYGSSLMECTIRNNSAAIGGGDARSSLQNCVIAENAATAHGGGSWASGLWNCSVAGNSALSGGGGLSECSLWNSIVYYNSALENPNITSCFVENSFIDVPAFMNTNGWTDLRLQSNSPCINAGNNAYVVGGTDLDGNPRIVGGTVDMGAYEFLSPQSMLSYAWLQQYGLPTDGSADYAHSDADPHNNWQEWKAWTNPTNELSVLRMLSPEPGTNGTQVTWESIAGHRYHLERATNFGGFFMIKRDILGKAGTTSFTDGTATNGTAFLYRVGVK